MNHLKDLNLIKNIEKGTKKNGIIQLDANKVENLLKHLKESKNVISIFIIEIIIFFIEYTLLIPLDDKKTIKGTKKTHRHI